ncbi:hypothetical protein BGZ73_006556 [Actinomortierella ambigua]|nr:hypothetical protein BGZ73_006556 [Actinomortierella ambigua]
MSYTKPDPNVFYPIPPGQLPPGFVAPPPGTIVRGVPIIVPLGLEMLISPQGYPVFVPDSSAATPVPSPAATAASYPAPSPPTPQVATSYPVPPGSTPAAAGIVGHGVVPTPITGANGLSNKPGYNFESSTLQYPPMPIVPTIPQPPLVQQQQQHQQPQQQPPLPSPQQQTPRGLTFASLETSFRTSTETFNAWIFYSLGLNTVPGQKEIVLTLKQKPGVYTLEAIQPILYQFFHGIHQHLVTNRTVLTSGDIYPCTIPTPDAGPKELSLLLVHAPAECKTLLENKDVLYGLLATREEAAVFQRYGAARCLSNMGNELETWPIPLWSDWSKTHPIVSMQDFEGCLLDTTQFLATRNVVATLDTVSHRMTLVMSSGALELIQQDLRKLPPTHLYSLGANPARVSFLLDLDPGSQAYLTWRKGQDGPAVFNARPNPTSYHGCWLSFVGYGQGLEKESIGPVEDGLEVRMNVSTWERLSQALLSKTPTVVPVGTETIQLVYA